jgi:hypothetical protein
VGLLCPLCGPVLTHRFPFTTTERSNAMQDAPITITLYLSDEQAWAFAQFLKRAGLDDYRKLAVDQDEAYVMLDAGEKVRAHLGLAWFAPR